jgi:hypothetical protein
MTAARSAITPNDAEAQVDSHPFLPMAEAKGFSGNLR